jgi:lipopolysaccharide transport system ATP-binding protein
VYTTCYVTRREFHSVALPEPWHRFVVIRDLRDTLVSMYFGVMFSHADGPRLERRRLHGLSVEESLLLLIADAARPPACAAIQQTWLESDEEPIRYEDLLERDLEILEPLLTRRCPLGMPAEQVREAVLACRFASVTGGRPRGHEDPRSHERKGVAGDWRNHFTGRVTRAFKARYGQLLVAAGYEKDLGW